ncbi:hypothetical protein B5998_14065 [Listeria monocytogenes]|nr:hypothetical protein [Listeria monocytogenes]EAG8354864.1 hypothetical protein [Listeria monocytogenes]EAG8358554.1 hypothetical protein [Listeria monocytogenes]EAG8360436.1 hypothetical protein [Listeria monocytogenes]EAG8367415.1 hypothetical protein [Listeria monocytogenes]
MAVSYQATIKNPFDSLEGIRIARQSIVSRLENLNVEDSSDSIAIDYYEQELFALDMFAGNFVFKH